jgi:hypothetical protein
MTEEITKSEAENQSNTPPVLPIISKSTEEVIEEYRSRLMEGLDVSLMEDIIQKNEYEFSIGDINYKVVKSTFAEKQLINKFRIKKFNEFLKDENMILEKDLRVALKNKGIDINEMDNKIINLERKKKDLQLKLGKALVDKVADSELKEYKSEIESVISEQQTISIEKNKFMEFSLEGQLTNSVYLYMTYIVTKKKVGEEWAKVWDTYEDFERNQDGELLKKATFYSVLLSREDLA